VAEFIVTIASVNRKSAPVIGDINQGLVNGGNFSHHPYTHYANHGAGIFA
jgi:hypothetical protein